MQCGAIHLQQFDYGETEMIRTRRSAGSVYSTRHTVKKRCDLQLFMLDFVQVIQQDQVRKTRQILEPGAVLGENLSRTWRAEGAGWLDRHFRQVAEWGSQDANRVQYNFFQELSSLVIDYGRFLIYFDAN